MTERVGGGGTEQEGNQYSSEFVEHEVRGPAFWFP